MNSQKIKKQLGKPRGFLFNNGMTIRNEEILMSDFRNKCKEHGLKVTPQRVVIYRELLRSFDHPTNEQVFDRLRNNSPEISLDTVYRTLSTFCEIGMVDLVEGYGTTMRHDPKVDKHHHFRCRKCGVILDFESDYYNNIAIPKDINKKCEVLKLRVTLEGFCTKCKKKSNN